jgi:uncharacterized protein (DUF1501 family)
LKGGLDGLTAVPPHGDPAYASIRPTIHVKKPLRLDADFGLHPALSGLHQIWSEGNLAVVHGTGFEYRGRSHFEGQDIMQTGVMKPYTSPSGWLGRAMHVSRASGGVAVSIPMPLILRGDIGSDTDYPNWMPKPSLRVAEDVLRLWANDEALKPYAEKIYEDAASASSRPQRMTGAEYRESLSPGALARAAGDKMKDPSGPRVGLIEFTHGFDTHANQGDDQGQHADRLADLDSMIREFKAAIGTEWKNSLVVTVTEFGRTVRENGTTGTDHGVGTCCLLAGGLVNKSKVYADWRGLDPQNWYEGRDLLPTIDTMAVYARVVQSVFRIEEQVIQKELFGFKPSKFLQDFLV